VSAPPTRPVTHWDATATETITPDAQGQQIRWLLHLGDSFTDVPRSSPFYRFVETLLHRGVTAGCTATDYCPNAATTREQMAVFVLVAKEGTLFTPPACGAPIFTDVPAASPFCRWIEELARRGVVSGCGGGNYCPSDAVTREQMAVFVLRTLDPALDPPACTTPVFADVPASSPFCKWIEELARRGVVTGCGGGNYCPTAAVTREQMGVFLGVTFGLTLYGP
jgi:S-layer family protein